MRMMGDPMFPFAMRVNCTHDMDLPDLQYIKIDALIDSLTPAHWKRSILLNRWTLIRFGISFLRDRQKGRVVTKRQEDHYQTPTTENPSEVATRMHFFGATMPTPKAGDNGVRHPIQWYLGGCYSYLNRGLWPAFCSSMAQMGPGVLSL